MRKLLLVFIALVAFHYFAEAASDGPVTGTIGSLHATDDVTAAPFGQGFRVVLTGLPPMCASGATYVYLSTSDNNYNAYVALLMLARAEGLPVTVWSVSVGNYCHITYLGPV